MTIKDRVERLEDMLAIRDEKPKAVVLLYDVQNPPDFDAVAREWAPTRVVLLPHNGRSELAPGQLLCGEKPQTPGR